MGEVKMTFAKRIQIAEKFESWVESFCAERMQSVARNGTEHTHPEFVELLRRNNKTRSKLIRFAPDGVMLSIKGDVFHWEAKCSVNIEKDAYETYMKYYDIGCKVIVFIRNKIGDVYWQNVENIKFIDSNDFVSKFPRPLPVVNGWISPRMGHMTNMDGSGTPYKVVDLDSLHDLIMKCEL
jgi:hypothetical protein